MHTTYRTIGSAGAILCLAAVTAAAQGLNNDQAQTLTGAAPVTGQFAPGASGRATSMRAAPVTSYTVGVQARLFLGGSREEQTIGFALGGGSTTPLADALRAAGAPSAEVLGLMSGLHALAIKPGRATLSSAIRAYNALVRVAPDGFIHKPPPQLLQLRSALLAIRAGV